MKNQIVLTFLIGTLISCTSELCNELTTEECPEKWQLISMSGQIANYPLSTGSDMAWQEWFLLFPDDTFIKTRERDNIVTEEKGTYAVLTLSDGKYLELAYESKNDIIGNCTGDAKELFRINSDDELIGTWWACDGPGLVYQKTEYDCVEH